LGCSLIEIFVRLNTISNKDKIKHLN
jgi:hypothetical protein